MVIDSEYMAKSCDCQNLMLDTEYTF